MKARGHLPPVDDLVYHNIGDVDKDAQFTVSGYPEEVLGENNNIPNPVKHQMYAMSGNIQTSDGDIIGIDMLTSKGQEGGALTETESGQIFGILTFLST